MKKKNKVKCPCWTETAALIDWQWDFHRNLSLPDTGKKYGTGRV